jgi:hypothetical protein
MDPELVECSCVPIGMNRSAMLLSIKGKAWDDYVDRDKLASIIDNGHLHGEKIPDDMRPALLDLASRHGFKLAAWHNKIPKFSSQPHAKGLALAAVAEGPAVASIATKAPLKAGKVPAEVETKQAEPPASQVPEVTLSAGAQTYKAGMEALVGVAKGMSEMVAQSDNPEIQKSIKAHASAAAALVKAMYGDAMKYFEGNKDVFAESATIAAQYEILAQEPDATMPNNEEEAEMQDDIKAEDEDTDTEVNDTPPSDSQEEEADEADDGEGDDEKAVDVVVTKAMFAEWEKQKFSELHERIKELEEKLDAVSDLGVELAHAGAV